MFDGSYMMQIDTPVGTKSGVVNLRTEGDKVSVSIDAPIIGKQAALATIEGNTFTAEGKFRLLLAGKIEYTMRGELDGDDLHIVIDSNKGTFEARGTREA